MDSVIREAGAQQPDLRPFKTDGKERYINFQMFTYDWHDEARKSHYRIEVPADFICDGASVPRWLWSLSGIRRDGVIRAAALVHDWIYRRDGKMRDGWSLAAMQDNGQWSVSDRVFTRREADELFVFMMGEFGVVPLKQKMAYYAIRFFARGFFNPGW